MRLARLAALVSLVLVFTVNVYADCTGCMSVTCTGRNGQPRQGLECIKDTQNLPPGPGILNCKNVAYCGGCIGGVCEIQPSGARMYEPTNTVIRRNTSQDTAAKGTEAVATAEPNTTEK